MHPPTINITNQNGSALVLVLTIIVILTILVGTMLSVEVVQHRFIYRDVRQLQALYTAEAGVYAAMDLLSKKPFWEVADTVLTLVDRLSSKVAVEAEGGYYLIRSSAVENQFQVTVLATVAQQAPAVFDKAVYLWDTTSRLNVAGTTVINGDIEVGQLGVRQNTLKGIRYTGELNGISSYNPDIQPAYFDDHLLRRSVDRFDQILETGHNMVNTFQGIGLNISPLLPRELPVYFIDDDLQLSQADSLLLGEPTVFVATGDLFLEGPLKFAARSMFLAGKRLKLEGLIYGENGVFYGKQAVDTQGITVCKGQFFSRQELVIKDTTYLDYPSLLFLAGEDAEDSGKIEVSGHARINGTLIHGSLPQDPEDVRGRIVVGQKALVRGAIYNPYETEIHGVLFGTLLTHQLFFYQSPTKYINWMLDAKIDVNQRPVDFIVPLLFNLQPDLKVVSWDVSRQVLLPDQGSGM